MKEEKDDELTIQDLETTLINIAKNFRKAKDYKPLIVKGPNGDIFKIDSVVVRILGKIMPNSPLHGNLVIKPSPVHGRGAFALKDFKVGDLLTFYPTDVLIYKKKNSQTAVTIPSDRLKEKMGKDTDFKKECDRLQDYLYRVSDEFMIMGDPNFDDNPSYFGQFINDKFTCNDTTKSMELYCKLSPLCANCDFAVIGKNLHVVIIATKCIKRGEELFAVYGTEYWAGRNKKV